LKKNMHSGYPGPGWTNFRAQAPDAGSGLPGGRPAGVYS